MKTCIKVCLLVMLSAFIISDASAEYCWIVGCVGAVGYIRIPAGQIDRALSKTVSIDNVIYQIDDRTLLFEKPGLPKLNETVVLHSRSSLASSWNSKSILDFREVCDPTKKTDMKAIDYEIDKVSKTAKLHVYWDDFGGGLLREGSVLKILKYVTCRIGNGDAHFALVEVIKD